MPCLTPYRGDSAQLLLFKIASCLEASGAAGASVLSFNGRTGDVILSLADVAAVGDGRYVLKAGDTMTGALAMPAGSAALPSNTFSGDLDTGIFNPAANTLGVSLGGVLRLNVAPTTLTYTGTGSATVAIFTRSEAGENRLIIQSGFLASVPTIGFNNLNFNGIDFTPIASGQEIGRITARGATNSAGTLSAVVGSGTQYFARELWTATANGSGSEFNVTVTGTTTRMTPLILNTSLAEAARITGLNSLSTDVALAIASPGPTNMVRVFNDGNVQMEPAVRLSIASGANQRAGDAVLVAGTVTVANTTVTANTRVFVSRKTAGGVVGTSFTYTLIAATSFTITSNNAADTSTVSYLLIEVP